MTVLNKGKLEPVLVVAIKNIKELTQFKRGTILAHQVSTLPNHTSYWIKYETFNLMNADLELGV